MREKDSTNRLELMPDTREYKFISANGFLFVALLLLFAAAWFAAVGVVDLLLWEAGFRATAVITLLFIGGLAAGYLVLRGKLAWLYLRKCEARVFPDSFELIVGKKLYYIPFKNVKRVLYKKLREEHGVVLDAKGHSLYIEDAKFYPPNMPGTPGDLNEFYQKLDAAVRLYRESQSSGEPGKEP